MWVITRRTTVWLLPLWMAQSGRGKHETVSDNLGLQFTFGGSAQQIFFSPAIKQIFAANCPDYCYSYKISVSLDQILLSISNDLSEIELLLIWVMTFLVGFFSRQWSMSFHLRNNGQEDTTRSQTPLSCGNENVLNEAYHPNLFCSCYSSTRNSENSSYSYFLLLMSMILVLQSKFINALYHHMFALHQLYCILMHDLWYICLGNGNSFHLIYVIFTCSQIYQTPHKRYKVEYLSLITKLPSSFCLLYSKSYCFVIYHPNAPERIIAILCLKPGCGLGLC